MIGGRTRVGLKWRHTTPRNFGVCSVTYRIYTEAHRERQAQGIRDRGLEAVPGFIEGLTPLPPILKLSTHIGIHFRPSIPSPQWRLRVLANPS